MKVISIFLNTLQAYMRKHKYVRTEPKLKLKKTIVKKRLNMKKNVYTTKWLRFVLISSSNITISQ